MEQVPTIVQEAPVENNNAPMQNMTAFSAAVSVTPRTREKQVVTGDGPHLAPIEV
jgi:hypothetical protein